MLVEHIKVKFLKNRRRKKGKQRGRKEGRREGGSKEKLLLVL
jgi:predicted transposase YdaD